MKSIISLSKFLIYAFLVIGNIIPNPCLQAQAETQNCCAETQSESSNDDSGCAYYGCSRAAHWSVYIPIAVLIAAAIWLGYEDTVGSSDHGHWASVLEYQSHNSSQSYGSYSNLFNTGIHSH